MIFLLLPNSSAAEPFTMAGVLIERPALQGIKSRKVVGRSHPKGTVLAVVIS
jgi:hypothetical protein